MILLVGAPSVGKTLLLKRLQNTNSSKDDLVPATIPTVGTNIVTFVTNKKTEVTVREMGGAMGPIWHSYFKDSQAVMFMIDQSKHAQVAISCVHLLTLLSHPSTQNTSVLILLNKVDVQNGMSRAELESFMRLEQVTHHASQNISVLEVSARTGHNLDKVARWLHQQNKLDAE